jgi:hypothetical protein
VSSQAMMSTLRRVSTARSEISCKLPIGVATMKSVPGICRLTQFYGNSPPLGELRIMKESFLEFFAIAVPPVVHPCPKLFWDMEVIVLARVIVLWFIIFALFRKQFIDLFNYCG